jgi:hypothetical protein
MVACTLLDQTLEPVAHGDKVRDAGIELLHVLFRVLTGRVRVRLH